jgi:hypothetical protein
MDIKDVNDFKKRIESMWKGVFSATPRVVAFDHPDLTDAAITPESSVSLRVEDFLLYRGECLLNRDIADEELLIDQDIVPGEDTYQRWILVHVFDGNEPQVIGISKYSDPLIRLMVYRQVDRHIEEAEKRLECERLFNRYGNPSLS